MKKPSKGEYRYQAHRADIFFDFSQEKDLSISEFFQNLSSHLTRMHHDEPRLLVLHIKGFLTEKPLVSLQEGKDQDSFQRGNQLLDQILSMKIPLISSINGLVGGPLLEPVLFSDFLFAESGTIISSLFVEKGYLPRMGMFTKISEILGKGNLLLFLMNGLELTTDVRRIFPLLYQVGQDAENGLDRFITELLDKSDYPIRLIKELSHYGKALPPRKAHLMERYNFALCFSDHQFKEKIETFFKKRV